MSKKFYAVRSGRKPGVYDTWAECENQVSGYSGAEYKSFWSREDAEEYVAGKNPERAGGVNGAAGSEAAGYEYPLAFVDGSYNQDTGIYGYGGFLSVSRTESYELSGRGNDREKASMRNVAGEIDGALAAVSKALSLKLPSLTIYYDYEGVGKWATLEWKANKSATKAYRDAMREAMTKIDIRFVHVDAHTGIPGNELADRMAKRAVGLLPEKDGKT